MYKMKAYNKETREMSEVWINEDCDRWNCWNIMEFLDGKKLTKEVLKEMMFKFEMDEESCRNKAEMFFSGEMLTRLTANA